MDRTWTAGRILLCAEREGSLRGYAGHIGPANVVSSADWRTYKFDNIKTNRSTGAASGTQGSVMAKISNTLARKAHPSLRRFHPLLSSF